MGAMAARRLLLLAALLLFIGSFAGALAPRERRQPAPTAPAPKVVRSNAETVRATLPRAGAAKAKVGDLVALRVRSSTADQAEIPAFGLSEPVGPDLVAEFTFVADRPGRFPVRLSLSGTELGAVVVRRG